MKKISHIFYSIALTVFFCHLTGCGSSDDTEVAGIDGSGAPVATSSGTIDGFGSVIVNGVRYDSSKSTILINNEIATENDLRAGYRVKIVGTQSNDDSGIANTIEFRPDIVGLISAIDIENETIVVLNQNIRITNNTLFDSTIIPNSIQGLAINDRVLISGKINNAGIINATRVELTTQKYQLGGIIQELNVGNATFVLRDITVNYSAATFNDIPNNQLINGMRVSVRGTVDINNLLQAEYIKGEDSRFGDDSERAEIEGFITRFHSISDFDVDGIRCSTNSRTLYSQGSAQELKLGAAVEIKGQINQSEVLIAHMIEFERNENNYLEGQVTAITLNMGGNIVTGTLQIGDTTMTTNASTRYEDKSDGNIRRFNLSSIQVGDFLQVSGFNLNNTFIATKIERKNADDNEEGTLEIKGKISSVGTQSIIVLNQEIKINDLTAIENAENNALTLEEFLTIAVGLDVEIKAVLVNGILTAREISIELADENDE